MVDELVYSELAKNFAATGQFLVRGVPAHGYGFVYPLLIAPAWRLFASIPDAYRAAKAINAVVMSLGRRSRRTCSRAASCGLRLALVAAALTVLVPSMLYTGMLMTENAFYPVFVWLALRCSCWHARAADRSPPGARCSRCACSRIETRAQAVALVAAVADRAARCSR